MKHLLIRHWLEQIYATQDTEIDCEQFQSGLPAYVDFEISGGTLPETTRAAIHTHLTQCPDCADEYEGLKAVAELEAHNSLPEVEESLAVFDTEATPHHPRHPA